MNLLGIVQEFCRRQGIRVPGQVVTSTDTTVLQVLGLLNEGATELGDRQEWFWLRSRWRFNHMNGPDYQALLLSSVTGYKGIAPRTLWAEDIRLPVTGPVSAPYWQQMILLTTAPAQYLYRIYGGSLYIYPPPAVPLTTFYSFEYYSNFPVADAGGVPKEMFTADTDLARLPDKLHLADLRWRWKKEKDQPYAEEMRAFESMVSAEAGRETNPGDVMLDTPDPDSRVAGPGLLIPAGYWNQ